MAGESLPSGEAEDQSASFRAWLTQRLRQALELVSAGTVAPVQRAWQRLGWRARLPAQCALIGGMALLPSIFAPEQSLLHIPSPTLVFFALGLYLLLRIGLD